MANYKEKLCEICHTEYKPNSGRQKRCNEDCKRTATLKLKAETYRKNKLPNKCNCCHKIIDSGKQFCNKHQVRRPFSVGYVEMLIKTLKKQADIRKLDNQIIDYQYNLIDKLRMDIKELKN